MADPTLHRTLRAHGIGRKNRVIDINMVLNFISNELLTSGSHVGYRTMHQHFTYNETYSLDRETVQVALQSLNRGVSFRQAHQFHKRTYRVKGPNQLQQIDDNDKLKPFGFSVHECIDGYSRKVLWLEVCSSNKNPRIVAKFYMDAVT